MLRHVRTVHCCQLELRDPERAQKSRFVRSESSFGHVRNEKEAVIHHESRVYSAAHLAEDVAHQWRHEQLPDLVLNRGNCFLKKSAVIALEFIDPKAAHDWVAHLLHHPCPIRSISQHPLKPQETYILAFQKSSDGGE